MTIQLYRRIKLHEKEPRSFGLWKVWHIVAYVVAAVSGVLNCYMLFTLCQLLGGRCALDPSELVFSSPAQPTKPQPTSTEAPAETTTEEMLELQNSGPLMLDIVESRFHLWSYCNAPLSVPLLSAVVALVWTAMFCVCPRGGRSRRGLSEPWRVVPPALLCSLVFAALTGHNFVGTDRGLQIFCEQFRNVTNTTACTSAMDAHAPAGWPPMSALVLLSRGACGVGFASWLVAAALLLSRCLLARDFHAHATVVQLHAPPNTKSPLPRARRRPERRRIQCDDVVITPADTVGHGSPAGQADIEIHSQQNPPSPLGVRFEDEGRNSFN